jgi:hypothetical protein
METLVAKVVSGDDSPVPDTPRPDGQPASSKSDAVALPMEKPAEKDADGGAESKSK